MRILFLPFRQNTFHFTLSAALAFALGVFASACSLDRAPSARVSIKLERGAASPTAKISGGPITQFSHENGAAHTAPALSAFQCFVVRAAWQGAPVDPKITCDGGQKVIPGLLFGTISGRGDQTALEFSLPQGPDRHIELIGLEISGFDLSNGCPTLEKLIATGNDSTVEAHAWKIGHTQAGIFGPTSIELTPETDSTKWHEFEPCEGGARDPGMNRPALEYSALNGNRGNTFMQMIIPAQIPTTQELELNPVVNAELGVNSYQVIKHQRATADGTLSTVCDSATDCLDPTNVFSGFRPSDGKVTFSTSSSDSPTLHLLTIQGLKDGGAVSGARIELKLAAIYEIYPHETFTQNVGGTINHGTGISFSGNPACSLEKWNAQDPAITYSVDANCKIAVPAASTSTVGNFNFAVKFANASFFGGNLTMQEFRANASFHVVAAALTAPVISYVPNSTTLVYTKGTAVASLTPNASGGAITSCSANPALPSGLILSQSDCGLGGVPTALSAAQNYSITASNGAGSSSQNISITVNDVRPAIGYSGGPFIFKKLLAITDQTPSNTGGAIVSCAVDPLLPAGLALSTLCVLSGTPTADTVSKVYTVTATNSGGSGSAAVTIAVQSVPAIAFSAGAKNFTIDQAIWPFAPTSSGGVLGTCTVSPALPAGLSLNASTCSISGTPTTVTAAADYTLKATNGVGNGTANINLTVSLEDTTPPTVVAKSPADGVTGVAVGQDITVQFSEDMNAESITASTISLSAGGVGVTAAVSYGSDVATLRPQNDLAPGLTYTVQVNGADKTNAVQDLAGNKLSSTVTWVFRTLATATVITSKIAAGFKHSCGIDPDGNLRCWGSNANGRLGIGSNDAPKLLPTAVDSPTHYSSIAAGHDHSCGLTPEGAVKCWGINTHGQLGDGSTSPQNIPVSITDSTTPYETIAAGGEHTCGITRLGVLKCWGYNGYSQLGNNSNLDSNIPKVIDAGTFYSTVAAGAFHTCAISQQGVLKCWGQKKSFTEYVNNGDQQNTPLPIAGGVRYQSVTAGFEHTCGITLAGVLKCWGNDDYGQLGNGETSSYSAFPQEIDFPTTYLTVSARRDHTCGITSSNVLKCWGYNATFIRLNGGYRDDKHDPVEIYSDVNQTRTQFQAISTGTTHNCGITTDGKPKCWGGNESGQVGDDTQEDRIYPTLVGGAGAGQAIQSTRLKLSVVGTADTTAGGKCIKLELKNISGADMGMISAANTNASGKIFSTDNCRESAESRRTTVGFATINNGFSGPFYIEAVSGDSFDFNITAPSTTGDGTYATDIAARLNFPANSSAPTLQRR